MQQSKVSIKYSEKIPSTAGSLIISYILEFLWEGVGWDGRLFEAGRLLTFSALGWALTRGWR